MDDVDFQVSRAVKNGQATTRADTDGRVMNFYPDSFVHDFRNARSRLCLRGVGKFATILGTGKRSFDAVNSFCTFLTI